MGELLLRGLFMPQELPGCRFSPSFSVQIVMQKSEKGQIFYYVYTSEADCESSTTFDVLGTKLSGLFLLIPVSCTALGEEITAERKEDTNPSFLSLLAKLQVF